MTLRRQLRVLRHRAGRWAGGRRWLASISLLAAMGVTAALLVLVVSENTVNATGAPAKAAAPSTAKKGTAPKSGVKTTTPTTKPVGQTVPLGVYAGPGAPVAATAFSADAGAPVPYGPDVVRAALERVQLPDDLGSADAAGHRRHPGRRVERRL